MWPAEVVSICPGADGSLALGGAGKGSGVGPSEKAGLDEALRLAIGLRGGWPRADTADAGLGKGCGEVY